MFLFYSACACIQKKIWKKTLTRFLTCKRKTERQKTCPLSKPISVYLLIARTCHDALSAKAFIVPSQVQWFHHSFAYHCFLVQRIRLRLCKNLLLPFCFCLFPCLDGILWSIKIRNIFIDRSMRQRTLTRELSWVIVLFLVGQVFDCSNKINIPLILILSF